MADEKAVFGYVCEVCAGFGADPLALWERGTLWQLFQMAESRSEARRKELKELIWVAHAEPKAFLASLQGGGEADGWMGLAAATGNHETVRKMKRDKMAARFLAEAEKKKNGR